MSQEILAAMNYYADLGLPIIPLCPADDISHNKTSPGHQRLCKCPGKIPLIAGWQRWNSTTPEHIEQWQDQFKSMNIGLPLGEASGYIGIDIDGLEGENLFRSMASGDIPATWEYSTGAGRRLLYTIPVGMTTKKFKKTGDGNHEECAILCTGQQTVLPPSKHFTGTTYLWVNGKSPYDLDCAMAPKWLIDLIKYTAPVKSKIQQRAQDIEMYAVDMNNIIGEFVCNEFDNIIPRECFDLKNAEVKPQKNIVVNAETETAQMLFKVLPEGSRDDSMTKIVGHLLSKKEYRNMPQDMFHNFMLSYNTQYCDPPLDDDAIAAKVNFFWEIESQKSAMYKDVNTKQEFNATQMAQVVLNLLREQKNLIVDYELRSGVFYTTSPNQGPWERRSNQYLQVIKADIRHYIEDDRYGDPSWGKSYNIREVEEAMKDLIIANNAAKDISFDMHDNCATLCKYIVVDGKLLDWKKKQLMPWDYNVKATHSFNIGYDPEATCPNWLSYMEQWIPDEGARRLVQEFLGYALIPDMSIPVVLFLDGSGSNGKSMLLEYIAKLFEGVVSSLSTGKMTERFGTAALYGKLINVCTEDEGDGAGYLKNTTTIKALSSGDSVTAEYKGKDSFSFGNTAKLVFATNKVPHVKDKTPGWDRRLKIVKFPNSFKNDLRVAADMRRKMDAETPGIFNWLLEGLSNLMDRGEFIVTESMKQLKQEYKASNEPLEGFLQECTRAVDPEDHELLGYRKSINTGVNTKYLYALYKFWCKDNYGDKASAFTKTPRAFGNDLKVKGLLSARGVCLVNNGYDRNSVILNITIDIAGGEFYERMLEDFRGYSPLLEPEGQVYMYCEKLARAREAKIMDLE